MNTMNNITTTYREEETRTMNLECVANVFAIAGVALALVMCGIGLMAIIPYLF